MPVSTTARPAADAQVEVPAGFEAFTVPTDAIEANELQQQGFELLSIDQKALPELANPNTQPQAQEAKGVLQRGKVGLQRSALSLMSSMDADYVGRLADEGRYARSQLAAATDPDERMVWQTRSDDITKRYVDMLATMIGNSQKATVLPQSKARAALGQVGANGEGILEQIGQLSEAVAQDPAGLLFDLTAENSLQLTKTLISVAAARGAGAGRVGEMAAGYANSRFDEFGAEYVNLRAQGESHEEAWEKAGRKAGVVALFDAASFGVTGKAVDKMIKTTIMQKVKAAAAGTAEDAIMGMGGEAWSQLVENGTANQVSLGDLFAEGFAELTGAPLQMAAQFPGREAELAQGGAQPAQPAARGRIEPTIADDLSGEQVFGEPEIVGTVDISGEPGVASASTDSLTTAVSAESAGETLNPPPAEPTDTATGAAAAPPQEGVRGTSQPSATVDARAGKESDAPIGEAPRPQALDDDQKRDLESARGDIGWFEEGGRVIRNAETDEVTGRTSWVGSPLWRDRPSTGGRVNEEEANVAIDKALRGERLSTREQRWVDHVLESRAEERAAYASDVPESQRLGLEDFRESILDPVADREFAELAQRASAYADQEEVEAALEAQDDDEAKRRLRALIDRGKAGGNAQAEPATDEANAGSAAPEGQAPSAQGRETDLFGADTERQANLNRGNARVARKLGEGRTSPPASQAPRGDIFREAAETENAQAAAAQTSIDEAAHAAATSPQNELPEPTEAQKEAGNYQKGHVRVQGLDISIENPAGSTRSGRDKGGKEWSVNMPGHYGYIRGTVGKDKDHIDVTLSPNSDLEDPDYHVFVVDQRSPDGKAFDEHKVFMGFEDLEAAARTYRASFTRDFGERMTAVAAPHWSDFTLPEFKRWLAEGDHTKPAKDFRKHLNAQGKPKAPAAPPATHEESPVAKRLGREEALIRQLDDARFSQLPSDPQGMADWFEGEHARLVNASLGSLSSAVGRTLERGMTPHKLIELRKKEPNVYTDPKGYLGYWRNAARPSTPGLAKPSSTGLVEAFSIGPKGATADLRDKMWKAYNAGQTKVSGVPEPMLAKAPRGLTREQFEDYLDGKNPSEAAAAGKMRAEPSREGSSPAAAAPAVSPNRIFKAEDAAKARELLKKKLGQISSGIDPEILQAGITLAGYHIESGARTFAAYTKAMIEDLGEAVRPYLRAWYEAVRYYPGFDATGLDSAEQIASAPSKQEEKREVETPAAAPAPEPVTTKPASKQEQALARFSEMLSEREPHPMRDYRAAYAEVMGTKAEGAVTKAVDELVELAIVRKAREIAGYGASVAGTFDALVRLYERQPTLGVRTSTSVDQQAYSTPAPLAYIAANLARIDKTTTVAEPTAGNGMLLITADPKNATVNELNPARADALRSLGFTVTQRDATQNPPAGPLVDAVIMNPPFGAVVEGGTSKLFKGTWPNGQEWTGTSVDFAIALKWLAEMKKDGRAVLIVGGVNKQAHTTQLRSDAYNGQAKRKFYKGLYDNYRVTQHFTVSGDLYAKQGAAWPVDVIVIEGRGKSDRALPAVDVPRVYSDWTALRALVKPYDQRTPDRVGAEERPAAPAADLRSAPEPKAAPPARPSNVPDASERQNPAARQPVAEPAGRDERVGGPDVRGRAADGSGRGEVAASRPAPRAEQSNARPAPAGTIDLFSAPVREAAGAGSSTPSAERRPAEPAVETPRLGQRPSDPLNDSGPQQAYRPASKVQAIGTLVPANLRTPVADALAHLQKQVGDLDEYVARELGYKPEELGKYFGAEQVDALAEAIYQFSRGSAAIIGDQTGIGKGRVVAGLIRWGLRNKRTPIFVTEKPNLYADIYRDLVDIGQQDVRPLMTNAGEAVPLDEQGLVVLKTGSSKTHNALLDAMASAEQLVGGQHNMIFTTYNQMQTVKGQETARMRFLRGLARNAIIITDESHNAGGQAAGGRGKEAEQKTGRAGFVRELLAMAQAAYHSSATYAKRPDVMDLYFRTDMALAVDGDVEKLPAAIERGGVPLQQAVAAMLTRAGQYLRRERSFAGVEYNTPPVEVDLDAAEGFSSVMMAVREFDTAKKGAIARLKEELKSEASAVDRDDAVGDVSISSTNFTSVMHNLVNQMLLGLTVDAAADRAIATLERGEKPVLTVANTMGSFIQDYVEETGLNSGDPIGIGFKDLLKRYLERTRMVRIKDAEGIVTKRRLTDAELGAAGIRAYETALEKIEDITTLDKVPVSPIDWLHYRLAKAGYKSSEITGRNQTLDYSTSPPTYRVRPASDLSIAGRRKAIIGFNNGNLHALVLNQAGSTGLSLHASEKFKDQRRRRMIIIQAEGNIDTHMQMLGRVHRTGQVVAPAFDQLVPNIPAIKRPAAVLSKKMASLSANTTADRNSKFSSKETLDFMNVYGDEVVAQLMWDMPEIHEMLGEPLQPAEEGFEKEDAARKVTGRLPLLPIKQQEDIYDLIAQGYHEALARADALGENALEAKTLPLDARTVSRTVVKEATNNASPFADGAYADVVDVKRLGKPFTSAQVTQHVNEALGLPEDASAAQRRATAHKKQQELLTENKAAFDDYYALIQKALKMEQASDNEIKAESLRLTVARDRWVDKMSQLQIGKSYRIYSPEGGTFYGVLTEIRHKSKIRNPVAGGAWMFRFDVADGMRSVTLPSSRVTFQPEGSIKFFSGVYLNPTETHELFKTPVMKLFDDGQSESREKRVMITGNLLAGFAQVTKGRIVNFTDSEGRVNQGIFMPRSFDMNDFKDSMPVELTAAQARELLRKQNKAIVFSSDHVVSVRESPQGLMLSVSRSKAEGGRYYLDPDLRKITGDFVSSGNAMRVVLSPMDAQDALDLISRKFEQKWVVESFKEEAKMVGGVQMASRSIPVEQKPIDAGHLDVAQEPFPSAGTKTLSKDEMDRELGALFKDSPTQAVAIDPSNPPAKWVKHMEYLQKQGVADRWRGFATTDPTNGRPTVLMRVGGFRSVAELERKAIHEAVHHGLSQLLGRAFDDYARKTYNGQGRDTFAAEIRDYFPAGNFDDTKAAHVSRVVNEYLARLGERIAGDSLSARARRLWDDFMGWLQKQLQRLGLHFAMEERQMRNLVRASAIAGMKGNLHPVKEAVSDLGLELSPNQQTGQSQNWFKQQLRKGQPIDRLFRAAFTPFGAATIDRHGEWHVNPAFKDATRRSAEKLAATATKRFTWLRPMAQAAQFGLEDTWGFRLKDRVLHGLVNRYGTPADFIARENQKEQELRHGLLEARALGERLMESVQSKEEAELLSAALRGDKVTDEQVRAVAGPVVDAIEDLGSMLVEAGVLTREAFERNRRKYHHRSYLRYEKTYGSPLMKWADQFVERRRQKLQGDIFRGRGIKFNVSLANLKKALPPDFWGSRFEENKPDVRLGGTKWRILDRVREPDDVAQLKTVEGESGKKAHVFERIYWPADQALPQRYAGWKDRGTYEVRDVKAGSVILWRDYNDEERRRMGEILDGRYNAVKTYSMMVKDLATARFFADIAKNPEWAQSEAPRKADGSPAWVDAKEVTWRKHDTYADVEWVRVPSSKFANSQTYRYGQLAGMYVRAPIWRDLAELEYLQLPGTWKSLLQQWKLNKTARSPVVHFNNVMSNFILMDLIDVRATEWARGLKSYLREDAVYQDALRHGVFGTSGSSIDREIKQQILDPILRELKDEMAGPAGKLHYISKFTTALKKADEWMRERYAMEDDVFRMAAYMKFLSEGHTPEEAAARARRQFIDYDIRAPWINMLRTTVLPFISYTYRAIPLLAEAVYKRPWKIAKYATFAYLANALGYALTGDDDEDKERRLMDEQYQGYTWMGTPRMVRLPFNDEYGNPAFMDVRRWMPAGDVFDMQGTTVDWMPAWLQVGGPLVLGFELGANLNTYKDEPIYDKDIDTGAEAAGKLAKHAWQGFMPNAPWIPGSYSYENLSNAVSGAKNGAYQDIPTLETLVGAFGPKVRYQNTEFNAQRAANETRAVVRKLDDRERAARRAFARGQMSDSELRDEIVTLEEKKARAQRGLAEKLNGPQEQ